MSKASTELEFEKAASLRDQIQSLESITGQQKVISERRVNEDVIAIAQDRNTACSQVFFVRGGKLLGKERFVMEGVQDENPGKVITSFIKQFYSAGTDIPAQILLQTEPEDRSLLETWLESQHQRKVKLIVPRRGKKKQLVEMVAENAAEALQQSQFKWLADAGKTGAALEELKARLHLPGMPKRIECYDISNIRGTAAVGSMVVFEEGRPRSAHYRRFKIKTVSGIDDYAMMQEVLRRRFARGIQPANQRKGESWGSVPDLVLIDGGRGHLNAVLQVMREMQVDSIPTASIAKENEEVFVQDVSEPIILPRNSQALYLLQRIRDEAHRFAISYHTRVRKQAAFTSALDQISGIGPGRKRALIKRFGSVKGIRDASLEELASVPGMTGSLAEMVKEHL
jgi:excinuclease ABC subunit C